MRKEEEEMKIEREGGRGAGEEKERVGGVQAWTVWTVWIIEGKKEDCNVFFCILKGGYKGTL